MKSTGSNLVSTKKLVYAGLFIALGVILKLFEIYITESIRINLTTLPIMVSGIMLGPLYGFFVGFLSDILEFLIKSGGTFHIGFTLTTSLYGIIPGLIAKYVKSKDKEFTLKHIIISVIICEIVCSMCLNTLWLVQLYGYATVAMIPQRILKACIMIVVNSFLLYVVHKNTKNRINL